MLWQIFRDRRRSVWFPVFPLLSACRFVEFDTSVIFLPRPQPAGKRPWELVCILIKFPCGSVNQDFRLESHPASLLFPPRWNVLLQCCLPFPCFFFALQHMHRLHYQPLFGKRARAPPPKDWCTELKPTMSSLPFYISKRSPDMFWFNIRHCACDHVFGKSLALGGKRSTNTPVDRFWRTIGH